MHATAFPRLVVVLLIGILSSTALAAKDKLKVGDEAPGAYLGGISWLKSLNDDPGSLDNLPVVVEFWATWCAPCKRAIPHLTKLQEKHGADKLGIIGVTTPDKVQSVADIKRFVQRQGSRMDYWVALDEKGVAAKELMKAAGQDGIPCAFIIGREGRIQYIGHPSDRKFDEILDKVVRGRYDHKSFNKAKRHLAEIDRARSIKNWDEYYRISKQVLEIDSRIFYELYLERFDVELLDRNNPTKAYGDAMGLMVTRSDDPELLAWMAEKIAYDPDIPDDKRNLDAALTLVTAARAAGGKAKSSLTASEAKIRLARGEVQQAVDLQRQAYYQAPKNRKDQFNRTLQDYKAQLDRDQE